MRSKPFLTVAHRLAILAYIVVALFPLFWLLKVSVTPNDLLYSEGVRMWPSRSTFCRRSLGTAGLGACGRRR